MNYIVTGANRGIGLEFVRQLAERGEHVIATARNPNSAEALQKLAERDNVKLLALDVTDASSVEAFEMLVDGPVDVLINNAGVYSSGGSLRDKFDAEEMLFDFNVNAVGTLRVTQALLPKVLEGTGKKVANITSKMGSIADNSSGGSYAYRMSKTALNMGTRCMANDLQSDDVVAIVLHPGWVQTDMGGPNAMITTEQSVSGMLAVIDGADQAASGRFWEWNGKEIPW